jgi:hypothetical protein
MSNEFSYAIKTLQREKNRIEEEMELIKNIETGEEEHIEYFISAKSTIGELNAAMILLESYEILNLNDEEV